MMKCFGLDISGDYGDMFELPVFTLLFFASSEVI